MITGKTKTVLVVEDSPIQAAVISEVLEQNGLRVLCAPDGQDGVYMARRYLPDAIVLDLEMPRMDGFQACRHIKENAQTAQIPILMLARKADRAAMVIEGIDLGAIDFIPKDSFTEKVLLETLRQLDILDNDRDGGE
jgi:CheY-like chemotaxis protein